MKTLRFYSIIWFMSVGLWVSAVFWLFAVILGGNPSFNTYNNSLNSIFLLTFGYMDFEAFQNNSGLSD